MTEIIDSDNFTRKELRQIIDPMDLEREDKIHKASMAYDDLEENEDFETKFLDQED